MSPRDVCDSSRYSRPTSLQATLGDTLLVIVDIEIVAFLFPIERLSEGDSGVKFIWRVGRDGGVDLLNLLGRIEAAAMQLLVLVLDQQPRVFSAIHTELRHQLCPPVQCGLSRSLLFLPSLPPLSLILPLKRTRYGHSP